MPERQISILFCIGCEYGEIDNSEQTPDRIRGRKMFCLNPTLNPGGLRKRRTFGNWTPRIAANFNKDTDTLDRIEAEGKSCFKPLESKPNSK